MGQRHQIYIVLPYEFSQRESHDKDKRVMSNVVSLHHQWLYGVAAGTQLLQFLTFCENGKQDNFFVFGKKGQYTGGAELASLALYSTNVAEGYFHSVSIEDNEVAQDPRMGDNNDGITIIDLRGENPKYCFMLFVRGYAAEPYEAIKALQYMEEYYGEKAYNDGDYLKENPELYNNMKQKMVETAKQLEKFEVLATEELKAIFPKMYETANE